MAETNPEVTPAAPAPEEKKQPTREEIVQQIKGAQARNFQTNDYNRRLAKVRRSGYVVAVTNSDPESEFFGKTKHERIFLHPSVEPSYEELKQMAPEDSDRLNFDWKNEKKGTHGVLATNRAGLFSMGKPRGRKNPHMTKNQQGIKSYSIIAFKELFEARAEVLKKAAADAGEKYVGVAESELAGLAAKAAVIGAKRFKAMKRVRRNEVRRRQNFHQLVNFGLLNGSSGERNFVL